MDADKCRLDCTTADTGMSADACLQMQCCCMLSDAGLQVPACRCMPPVACLQMHACRCRAAAACYQMQVCRCLPQMHVSSCMHADACWKSYSFSLHAQEPVQISNASLHLTCKHLQRANITTEKDSLTQHFRILIQVAGIEFVSSNTAAPTVHILFQSLRALLTSSQDGLQYGQLSQRFRHPGFG